MNMVFIVNKWIQLFGKYKQTGSSINVLNPIINAKVKGINIFFNRSLFILA